MVFSFEERKEARKEGTCLIVLWDLMLRRIGASCKALDWKIIDESKVMVDDEG